jgi:lambda family phage tail tape measure protein
METDFVRERNNLEIQSQTLALDQYKMNEWDYQLAQNRIDLEKRLQGLYAQRVALNTRTDKNSPEFLAEQERIDAQIQGEKDLNAIRAQGIEADRYRAHSFEEGWKQAFKTFSEQSVQYGRMGADMFNSVVGNMNSAIDNFVKTGKFAFKDFAKSVIQDLIAIEMKMQAMAMLRMALNSMGFTTMGGATGKASGGMVSQGVPYMVGEQGPELFIPQKGGAIVPSNRVGDALMGSGQPSVVYNGPYIASMSAIDTQSATQFLARNKSAVWAANQSAGRSVPASR